MALQNQNKVTPPPQNPSSVTLSINNLHKSYGKKQVLKGVQLQVCAGELFGFIGKNGAGKSTTIDCVTGIKPFNEGQVFVCGHDISREGVAAKRTFGYVASEPTCYEMMTGFGFLEFVAGVFGVGQQNFSSNLKYLSARLALSQAELSQRISAYSHGMKQKLCLIASLLHSPKVWILDEPTVGLDVMAVEELQKMMREYADHGNTVFITSHNIELVSKLCDRVAVVSGGVVASVYDLKNSPNLRLGLARNFMAAYGGV